MTKDSYDIMLFVRDVFTGAIGDMGTQELGVGIQTAADKIEGFLCAKVGRALTPDEKAALVHSVRDELADPYSPYYKQATGGKGGTVMYYDKTKAKDEPLGILGISQSEAGLAMAGKEYAKRQNEAKRHARDEGVASAQPKEVV